MLIDDRVLCSQWQLTKSIKTARDVWSQWIEQVSTELDQETQCVLETILTQGNLSERLLKSYKKDHSKFNLQKIYNHMADCLVNNQMYVAS